MQPTENIIYSNADIKAEKLYDTCMIEKFCRGNQDQLKKMIRVFIEQTPRSVEEIKLAYNNKDFVQMKNAAHRIKPVLSYYAIVKIAKDIQQIENMAKEELDTEEMALKINRLDEVLSEVVARMKKDFPLN
jgi:HPt (histidine-containing phosphotransfer) domain-containing protein